MSMDLNELADRVEALAGPDRALDAAIAVAIDWRWDGWEEGESTARSSAEKHGLEWLIDRCISGYTSMWRGMPAYTASIDAAMTLVPEGWEFTLRRKFAELRHPTLRKCDANSFGGYPAIALTAAALRTKALGAVHTLEGGL